MDISCYLFDAGAVDGTLNLIQRLCRAQDIAKIALVVHASIPLTRIIAAARLRGLHDRSHYIATEGTNWEFGAYQRGLDDLSPCTRGLIVINDTAGRNYPFFAGDMQRFIAASSAVANAGHPAIVGKIESQQREFSLMGNRFDKWIRSNIFYINAAGLLALHNKLYDASVFLAPTCRDGRLVIDLPLSDELAAYLLRWLSPAAGAAGWLDHSARSKVSDSVLRGKLGSILLEKHLSARLEAVGGEFFNYEPAVRAWCYDFAIRLFFKRRRLLRIIGR